MDNVSLIENFDKELDEDLLKALMIGIVQLEEFKGKEHVDVISDAKRKIHGKNYK
jgi:hypothetical protein